MMNTKHAKRRYSRKQRVALYLISEGRCALCGTVLQPGWHGDHYNPYSRGGPTTVENGRALCSSCNLSKGNQVPMSLQIQRPFQQRFHGKLEVCLMKLEQVVASGKTPTLSDKTIVANIYPGSGKTLMSLLGINTAYTKDHIDTAVIYVPRITLAVQVEVAWRVYRFDHSGDPLMGSMLHRTNTPPLISHKQQFGYVTSYASLVSCPELHLDYFQKNRGRIMLVLDEAHIAGLDPASNLGTKAAEVVLKLAEYAKLIVLMTGTPTRSDGRKLILAQYSDPDENGLIYLQSDVTATYLEGVAEGYLRPLDAELFNAEIELEDLRSSEKNERALEDLERGLSAVLKDRRFYGPLIDRSVEKLLDLQQSWPKYCGIISAVDQAHAREIEKFLKRNHPKLKVLLAISDNDDSQRNLELFKQGGFDFLVTVEMVHVGFDHKPISVVCCLSNVRDESWLRQFFARGMRMAELGNPDLNEAQRAFIVVPNDRKMREVVEALRSESEAGLAEKQAHESATSGTGSSKPASQLIITNITLTDGIAVGLDPDDDVGPEEFNELIDISKRFKLGTPSIVALKGLKQAFNSTAAPSSSASASSNSQANAYRSELNIEADLRKQIKKIQQHADRLLGAPETVQWGETYIAIRNHLGHEMQGLDDVRIALEWLQSTFLPECKQQAAKTRGVQS